MIPHRRRYREERLDVYQNGEKKMEPYISPQGIFSCFFSQGVMKNTPAAYFQKALDPEGVIFESENSEYGLTVTKTIQVHAYHRLSEGAQHLYFRVISQNESSSTVCAFTLTGVHFERDRNSSMIKVTRITQKLLNPGDDQPAKSEEYNELYKSSSYLPDMSGKAKRECKEFDLSSYPLKSGFQTVFDGAEHLIPVNKNLPRAATIKPGVQKV